MTHKFTPGEELYGIAVDVHSGSFDQQNASVPIERVKMLINKVLNPQDWESINERVCVEKDERFLGTRLAPQKAASCFVTEPIRTYKFWRGLQSAVWKVLDRPEGRSRPAQILYIGSGPYAALALPTASFLGKDRVQFHLVDPHRASLDCARKLVDGFGIGDRFGTFLEKDARELDFANDLPEKPDIVMMEIMNRALCDEPQADVTRCIAPELCDAILIPEKVEVDVRFSKIVRRNFCFVGPTQPFVRLTKEGLWAVNGFTPENLGVAGNFQVPEDLLESVSSLTVVLTTRVDIYGGFTLEPDEEVITTSIRHEMPRNHIPKIIKIAYNLCGGKEAISLTSSLQT